MNTITVTITQIINKFQKEHLAWSVTLKVCVLLGAIWTLMQLNSHLENVIHPEKIYLVLWETGRRIPLNEDGQEIPSIKNIKADEAVTLRFNLLQDNKNSPQITAILLTFPDNAKVEFVPYQGWTWVRNNDRENRYFLNFSPDQIPAKGSNYNLPAFNVTFKKVGLIPFSYQINVNKINPIRRSFIINTAHTYEEWQNKKMKLWINQVNPNGNKSPYVALLDMAGDGNSASPNTVEARRFKN